MLTLEQAIASYEKSAERYHRSFLRCKAHGGEFYQEEAESNKICYEHDRQLAAWLRELQERREQSELDSEALIRTIEMGITATNSNDIYSLGMRNGMRWCKSLIDNVEPKFEDYVTSVDDGKYCMNNVDPDCFCFLAERRTDAAK